jgi:putative transposase
LEVKVERTAAMMRTYFGRPSSTIRFRGSQYAAGDYRKILQAATITQSMSRKGNCWDNAPMESFFGTLKTELVYQRDYPDREAARRDLFAYIEGYYNRRRIHSAIGYITPEQADRKSA